MYYLKICGRSLVMCLCWEAELQLSSPLCEYRISGRASCWPLLLNLAAPICFSVLFVFSCERFDPAHSALVKPPKWHTRSSAPHTDWPLPSHCMWQLRIQAFMNTYFYLKKSFTLNKSVFSVVWLFILLFRNLKVFCESGWFYAHHLIDYTI